MSLSALSPIRAAARDGRLEEVRRITEEEGPADGVAPPGWTAVQWAAMRGRTEVVLYLLEAGGREAEWDAEETVDNRGMLRVAYGVEPGPIPVHGSPLCLASLRGHEETVRALLEAGAGGPVEEGAGRPSSTALSHAARGGHAAVVGALLAAGANVNEAAAHGLTSLMFASDKGHERIVEALLAAGANVNAANASNLTSLMYASKEGHERIVEALLTAGAKVNLASRFGVTSLIYASASGNVRVVEALLAAGAEPNVTTLYGGTVLSFACADGHTDIALCLLHHGAAVTRDAIRSCPLPTAEALVIRGGVRVTETLVAAVAPTSTVRSFLDAWLAGTHPVQLERREAEDALLAVRWGAGGAYFPAEVVSIVGEYVHARERRVRGRGGGSRSSSSS